MNENRYIIAGVAAGVTFLAVFFLGKNLVIGLVLGIAAFIIFAVLFRPSGTCLLYTSSLHGFQRG